MALALIRAVGAFVLAAVLVFAPDAAADPAEPSYERGKRIFLRGKSASGREITAFVGKGATALPAGTLPCASCHGGDGLGRPEGGVVPANITWRRLTRSHRAASPPGRSRPAYNEATLARAIATGIDTGGARLDPSMPRFEMHADDMADLIAYLKRLGDQRDPGLSAETITLGTLLPAGGRRAALWQAVEAVLRASFADINAQGGIYNRRLELKVASASTRERMLAQGRALIESGEVFALTAPVTAGLEAELHALVERHRIPLIAPFTQFPAGTDALPRFAFYLYGGPMVEARTLSRYASDTLVPGGATIAVVHPLTGSGPEIAHAIRTQAERRQWPDPIVLAYPANGMNPAAMAAELAGAGTEAVLFLGSSAELKALAVAGGRRGWKPYLLMPGSRARPALFDLPAAFQDRVFLAYPTGPADYTKAGADEFNEFRHRHGLSSEHTPAQIAAYAAVKLLAEGLKAAGRGLSREKLVHVLERLYQFETGLTPKLTFGPNRRIGGFGAHIVAVDLHARAFGPQSRWVALN